MGYKRNFDWRAFGAAALLGVAGPSPAATGEPLIVSQLSEPDPGLVAAPEPMLKLTKLAEPEGETSSVDRALENLGRALSDAVLAQQQATAARCHSGDAADRSSADRFAWAASCRYSRH